MTSYPSFNELADQLTDKKHFSAIISRQQKFFETNPYKIEKLYSDTAKKIYSQILNKYQVTQEFKIMENAWQENERRVFVWYMIILVDLHYINLEKINQINWSSLTSVFFDKNQCFLEFQFANILKSKSKITWNEEEDKILLEAMSKEKQGKWNEVSKRIFYESDGQLFKSPKHCRERWFNHLDETKHKGSWTLQEDYTIFKFIMENGKRWACIVKLLENSRTEHMIKNRYNSLISKLKKNKKRREEEITELVFKSLETEVKNQRRERKLKNLEKNNLEKKTEILETENALENSASKPEILEEKISENSTDKVSSIKIEEEAQDEETPKIEVQNNEEGVRIEQEEERPLLNFYHHYAEEYMPFHPYQFFYFCQQSAFMPINPMMFD